MRNRFSRLFLMSLAVFLSAIGAVAQHTQKNTFAYDIRVNGASPHNPVVSYRLNSGASSVTIRAKQGATTVATVNGGTSTTGVNTVTVPIPGNITGTVSFEVEAKNAGSAVSNPTNVKMGDFTNTTDNYYGWRFNLPIGLAINNATESPVFGQMVVAEHNNMTSTSTAFHSSSWRRNGASNGRGNALYVFDPQGGAIINSQSKKEASAGNYAGQSTYGFSGNLAMNNNAGEFNRIRFSGDGRLFMYSNQVSLINSSNVKTGNEAGVYEFHSNSNSSAHVADFYNTQANKVLNLAVPTINASVNSVWSNAFDVVGSGNDVRFGILVPGTVTDNTLRTNIKGYVYNVAPNGSVTLLKELPSASGTALANVASAMYMGMAMDRDGKGLLINKDTTTPSTTNYGFLYYAINGTPVCEFSPTSGDPYRRVTSVAYNKDGTLLAISTKEGKIFVYKTSSASGGQFNIGSLLYTITSKVGTDGFSVFTDVAFDYANNLYALNRTREYFACWQLPGYTQTVVPAPSSQNINITANNFTLRVDGGKWNTDNKTQSATISWSAVSDANQYAVYLNGTKVSTVSATSANVTLAFDRVNSVYVKPIFNGVEATYSSESVTVYHADYQGLTATATSQKDGSKINAVVSWTPSQYGNLTAYEVRRYLDPTSPDIYDVVYTGQSNTFTDSDIKNTYYYKVIAMFANGVYPATSPNTAINSKESNFTDPVVSRYIGKPSIDELETYEGRNTIRIHWVLDNDKALADYFTVYRDGEVLMEKVQYREFNDYLLDNGDHTYTVDATYLLGDQTIVLSSEPAVLTSMGHKELKRNHAQTRYGIEEVYNVPILSREEAGGKAAFITDNSDLTKNMSYAEAKSETAHRGGLYRQAKFRDGKWYITQIHDFTPEAASDYVDGNTPVAEYTGTETDGSVHGGVIVIDAENKEDILKSSAKRIIEYNPNLNQALGCDRTDNGLTFVTRSGDGLYNGNSRQLTLHHFDNSGNAAGTKTIDLSSDITVDRVHYMAADGDLWSGTGYIYMAQSHTNRMYVITVLNGEKSDVKEYELPADLIGKFDPDSENYALPIEGTDDFLWQIRDNGYYHVNVGTDGQTTYRKIHDADVAHNAGALTFLYDNEVFFMHPVSSFSRNSGNFTVDLPRRRNDQTVADADFTELVPILTFNQEDTNVNIEAAGANGVWFGTQHDAENNEMYIYVYVPGERFAKYRFYRFAEYPEIREPELNIVTVHNDDNTEVTGLQAELTWKRPADYNDASDYAGIKLVCYDVTIADNNGAELRTLAVNADDLASDQVTDNGYDNQDQSYTYTFATTELQLDREYNVEINPVYEHISDKYVGQSTPAVLSAVADYPVAVGDIDVEAWVDEQNGSYRVDIDFNAADKADYPDPVSYFLLTYSDDNGETWKHIPNLWIFMNGGQPVSSADDVNMTEETHNGQIPGTYYFDLVDTEDSELQATYTPGANYGDKGIVTDEGKPCVAFYYTDQDPTGYLYRVQAVYGATNPAVTKIADSDTQLYADDMFTTGVNDVSVSDSDDVAIYPVPAVTTLTVRSTQPIENIKLHSMTGALVKNIDGNGDTTMTINVSDLPKGNYLVTVNNLKPLRMVKN